MYDGSRIKDRGLNWDDAEREAWPTVAAFLDQATNPDPKQRFTSAAEAKAALSAPSATEAESRGGSAGSFTEPLVRSENEVAWLQSLLQSYPVLVGETAKRVASTRTLPSRPMLRLLLKRHCLTTSYSERFDSLSCVAMQGMARPPCFSTLPDVLSLADTIPQSAF